MHLSFISKYIDNFTAKNANNTYIQLLVLNYILLYKLLACSNVVLMYYSRKSNLFDLTIYKVAYTHNAFCYTWTEFYGKQGSLKIGSCLYKQIQTLPTKQTNVKLYSDSCGNQNKNHIIINNIYIIKQHTFLESGHSIMKVN